MNASFWNRLRKRLSNYRHYDIEAVLTVIDYLSDPERVQREVGNQAPTQFFIEPKESWARTIIEALNRCYGIGETDKAKKTIIEYIKSACQMKPEKEELFPLIDQLLILLDWHLGGPDLRTILGKKPVSMLLNHRVFTTNYDNVLCAYANRRGAVLMNGEISQNQVRIRKRDNPPLFDKGSQGFRVYRLHGYITWFIDKHEQDIRYSGEVLPPGRPSLLGDEPEREAMIFPLGGKYIYREPYCDMFFYLKEILQEEKLVTVVGYSFRDMDVVGLFVDASILNPEITMVLLDPRAEEIKKEWLRDFRGRILTAVGKFDKNGLHALEKELARWLILRYHQTREPTVEVQYPSEGDADFETAFDEACAKAGDTGKEWQTQRVNGTLELFKVISGPKFTIGAYDYNSQTLLDAIRSLAGYREVR